MVKQLIEKQDIKGGEFMRKLTVIIEQEEDGGYSVYVPELPGCASQGDTLEEALVNIKEAIELYLWSLKEDLLSPEEIGAAAG